MSPASDRDALGALLRRHSLKFGEFQLAHGGVSRVYLDARLTVMRPDAVGLVGRVLLDAVDRAGWSPVAAGGLATGAIPLATALAKAAGDAGRDIAGFFVRKEEKAHGRGRRVEGIEKPAGPAVILEDTATTGRSTLLAVEAARAAGFEVVGALTLVDREMGAKDLLGAAGAPLHAVFRLRELAAGSPAPGDR